MPLQSLCPYSLYVPIVSMSLQSPCPYSLYAYTVSMPLTLPGIKLLSIKLYKSNCINQIV